MFFNSNEYLKAKSFILTMYFDLFYLLYKNSLEKASSPTTAKDVQSWKNEIDSNNSHGLNRQVMVYWADTTRFKVSSSDQVN